MTEDWTAIIAAAISAIGTLLIAKVDDIADLLRKPTRKIAGEWDGISYIVSVDPEKPSEPRLETKHVVSLGQKGCRVSGMWMQSAGHQGHVLGKFTIKGRIEGDYFVCESVADASEQFMISSAILYVHPRGQEMFGYFVANGGRNDPKRTLAGYTELKRKK